VITVALVVTVFLWVVALLTGKLDSCGYRLMLLLLGKLPSYASSCLFHLAPTKRPETEATLLRSDLVTVSIAMWAPSGAFAANVVEWNILLTIMLCVTTLNLFLVQRPRSLPYRSILLLLYFAFNVTHIGWHYGYRGLWTVGVVCYLAGFLLGPPLHHRYHPAFWHVADFNSWHEDFHLLLCVADTCFLVVVFQSSGCGHPSKFA
jgi:hypothetical protein